jgi:hypothetical protein
LRLGGDIYLQDSVGFESNLPLTFIEWKFATPFSIYLQSSSCHRLFIVR